MNSTATPTAEVILAPTPGQILRRRIFGHRGIVIGGGIFFFIVLMAVFAPLLAPYDPYHQDLIARMAPPVWQDKGTWNHILGTDQVGRDYLSRLIYGARISLMIGIMAALISGIIGTVMGVAAGYFGGKVDLVVTFLITCRLSLPVILVSLAVVAIVGGSLEMVILVLGLLLWDRYAVVMRSSTQQIRSLDYVAAAQAAGCSTWYILAREILPNVMNQLIVVATLEFAHAVLLEAALSFLGLGVQPPLPSWGLMISEGRNYILFDPWLIAIPGSALFLLLLAVNLLGDGVRDVTVPENRA
ncbi:ABC transporter permease [Thalassobaculum sp. OXR-137]|uniref:ABC transporter permease n=1 Tax=Thalassobaculum sp. OXR-137 TaxID=3100173 RepID=UPI002AC9ED83|nr:ABC transporter permease [Thalassobaculum sp. OXR-137]WPZ35910.1 ABC transporter permease [Thalassobaculum sp. OXR-137]